ncbi:MAG: hypothetical protein ABJG95_00085 [Rhizobiaceae bacterium]
MLFSVAGWFELGKTTQPSSIEKLSIGRNICKTIYCSSFSGCLRQQWSNFLDNPTNASAFPCKFWCADRPISSVITFHLDQIRKTKEKSESYKKTSEYRNSMGAACNPNDPQLGNIQLVQC